MEHRYVFVLHTDERLPHVHAVVKAVSERGVRLKIWSGVLRQWRQEFARHLRAQGVEANATERAVRGESRVHKLDGIYRAARHGASTHMRERAEAAARELQNGALTVESGKSTLERTQIAKPQSYPPAIGSDFYHVNVVRPGIALYEVVTPRDSVLSAIGVADCDHEPNARCNFIKISNADQNIQDRLRRDIWYGRTTDVLNIEQMHSDGRDDSGSLTFIGSSPSIMRPCQRYFTGCEAEDHGYLSKPPYSMLVPRVALHASAPNIC